ncbi:TRAF3-interacting JNK-activating modulator isoform X2 [Amblyraja radiata]|uniref:TRAF3-interacting JNK-activating modulator isoform X2 n=1 Tax=Amblyraja radiata TaxID=386614 RepID=UPI001403A019|nr:TRAF3-interacting JNK-activating modulator isoform X2 [Amblyraja radiata]
MSGVGLVPVTASHCVRSSPMLASQGGGQRSSAGPPASPGAGMEGLTPKRGSGQGGSDSAKKRRLVTESYEQKVERRYENRHSLLGRNNVTSCRSSPRQHSAQQNPRQQAFLKRRNLALGEDDYKPHGGKNSVPGDPSNLTSIQSGVGSVPAQQNSISLTQMSPQLSPSTDGLPFSKQLTQRAAEGARLTLPISPLTQHKASTHNVPTRDKATQMPPAQSQELGRAMRRDASQQTECGVTVLDQEIQQLSEYLKEALHRELKLKQKMAILQQLLATLLQAAEKSWKVQLDDDALRCKLQSLEAQLHTWAQNHSRDGVKESMMDMQQQKLRYEQVAKEQLQRATEEKTAAERSLDKIQRSLQEAEREAAHWREAYHGAVAHSAEMNNQHLHTTDRLHIAESKLQRAESDGEVLRSLQSKLEAVENETHTLLDQIDALKEDNELKEKQLQMGRAEIQNAEEQKQGLGCMISQLQEMLQKKVAEAAEQERSARLYDELRARTAQREATLQQEVRQLVEQLEGKSCQLHSKQEECNGLQSQLATVWDGHHAQLTHPAASRNQTDRMQKRPAQVRF